MSYKLPGSKTNPDGTITVGDVTYNPKTHFVKRRGGKVHVFDKQIKTWRKRFKSKGALKDSINYGNQAWNEKQLLKRMGYGS